MSGRGTLWWVGLASAAAALAAAWLLFGAPGPTAAVPAPGVVADPLEARPPGVRSGDGNPAPPAAAAPATPAPATAAPATAAPATAAPATPAPATPAPATPAPATPAPATPAPATPAPAAQPSAAPASVALAAPATIAQSAPAGPATVADPTRQAAAPQVPSPADLRALQAGLYGQLASCFEAAAARTPPATGTVVLAFTLVRRQGFGRLQNPRIETDSVGDSRFARCLLAQTPEADFPAEGEDGEVAVRLPIDLRGNPRVAAVPEAASASSAPGAQAGEVTPASTDTPPAEVAGEEDP